MIGVDRCRTRSTTCIGRLELRSFLSSFFALSTAGHTHHCRYRMTSPQLQRFAAHTTHWGLYILLIAQPLTGWIATSAYRASVTVFGWFELPPIWHEDRAFSEQLFFVHRLMGLAITCLVAAHIGAALYHHLVRKDRILLRMVTG